MIELKNISFAYQDVNVLNDITLTLENNKIYGLIGKNGIGKTTLLKVISRYINTNKGDIILDGKSIKHTDFLDTNITYVFDECICFNELTFIEHLILMAKSSGLSKESCMKFIHNFIATLDLDKYENSYPNTLSKGTLQRLNIGMGLIRNAPYLLMDEPFNGLDPVQTMSCITLIKAYQQKLKSTIIISSHQLDNLSTLCDEYLIMTSLGILKVKKDHINEKDIIEMLSHDTVN